MKQIFSCLCIVLAFMSCNNAGTPPGNTAEVKDPSTSAAPATADDKTECYSYIKNKDSILLHLDIDGNKVTGDMVYSLFEKDRNAGAIDGVVKGDTIFASYTFMSEGTNSMREVAFLKKGNTLLEGFGDVEERDNKMIFKNKQTLSFNQHMLLQQTACE